MSSDIQATGTRKWGRIFVDNKVSELDSFEHRRSQAWTEKDQEEYLERVRRKAEEKAREILLAAQAEAKDIRERAQADGYAEGARRAETELAELRSTLGDSVHAVLGAIEERAGTVYAAWREDLTAVLRLAVEKCVGLTVSEDRAKVLEALFNQAVQSLESARRIVVRCNPEDAAAVEDIIAMAREKYPELSSWKVRGEASVQPGGIMVESESSLANNTVESRLAAIDNVLVKLNIPAE